MSFMELYMNYLPYIDFVFYFSVAIMVALEIRASYRLRKGKDIVIQPQLTLFTDDGDKIFVIAVNESQGKYVLYHSRNKGLQLVSRTEFLKLKSSRD